MYTFRLLAVVDDTDEEEKFWIFFYYFAVQSIELLMRCHILLSKQVCFIDSRAGKEEEERRASDRVSEEEFKPKDEVH